MVKRSARVNRHALSSLHHRRCPCRWIPWIRGIKICAVVTCIYQHQQLLKSRQRVQDQTNTVPVVVVFWAMESPYRVPRVPALLPNHPLSVHTCPYWCCNFTAPSIGFTVAALPSVHPTDVAWLATTIVLFKGIDEQRHTVTTQSKSLCVTRPTF